MDGLTGLIWCRDANLAEFPLTWQEALDFVAHMNREQRFGQRDWRMPNRRELRSLLSLQTKLPALPESHPFINVFNGWYWSATAAAISPAHAWYVALDGARWPQPRFEILQSGVLDCLTRLLWRRSANLTTQPVIWHAALAAVTELNHAGAENIWRLPTINELESLVDCAAHGPALPAGHPFSDVQNIYWSSTTSLFEPDWAWALYLEKVRLASDKNAWHNFQFGLWQIRLNHSYRFSNDSNNSTKQASDCCWR